MPTRLCAEPRCPNPATYRGRCANCSTANERRTHRNRTVYNSKRWALLRRHVLFEQPICLGCDDALSVDVDHIVGIQDGGQPYERANLQGLCKQCHGIKTKREQATQ